MVCNQEPSRWQTLPLGPGASLPLTYPVSVPFRQPDVIVIRDHSIRTHSTSRATPSTSSDPRNKVKLTESLFAGNRLLLDYRSMNARAPPRPLVSRLAFATMFRANAHARTQTVAVFCATFRIITSILFTPRSFLLANY